MGPWLDSVTGWLTVNPQWLAAAVFIVAFVECLAIAGLIVPGTVLLFAVAVLAGSGALSLGETLLLGFLAGVLGDVVSYFIGRHFHQNIRRLPGLRHHPEWIAGAEAYFQRYGIASLLVGRFIGPLRPMLPMVAGMFDMPFPRFAAVSLLAAAGWSVAYLLPGWATGAAIRLPLPEGFWPEAGIVAGSIAVMVGLSITSSLRRHRKATMLITGMSFLILAGLFIGYPHLTALDQGVMTLVQEHRSPLLDEVAVVVHADRRVSQHAVVQRPADRFAAAHPAMAPGDFRRQHPALHRAGQHRDQTLFRPRTPGSVERSADQLQHAQRPRLGSFALFLTLAVLAGRGQPPRMRLTWLLLGCLPALAIALSRVYLGAHWPTDVLAGAMLAACVCAASLWLSQRQAPLNAMPPKVWWLVLPALVALFGFFALRHLPHAMLRYAY